MLALLENKLGWFLIFFRRKFASIEVSWVDDGRKGN
jgi:hypothetical protein